MSTSIYLAKLIGPALLMFGAGILIQSSALPYAAAVFLLAAGAVLSYPGYAAKRAARECK